MEPNLQKFDLRVLRRGAIAVSIVLAAMTLASCLALLDSVPSPDQPRFWMRSEAYQTAVEVALARSDVDRNDPSLIGRDFTRQLSYVEGQHSIDNYTPCPLTASELISPNKVNCSLSPGVGGVRNDPSCPWQTCVAISVRSETWADPVARQVIRSTLADFDQICASATTFGLNHRFDAMAAECDRPNRKKVRVAIEVKPRLFQPCVYNELTRGERHFYHPICANSEATLVIID